MKAFWAALARISSSSFAWIAAPSRFWVFWIRKTIRKVTIVVAVLMMSCHVSEKWNSGPLEAQIAIRRTHAMNVTGRPVTWATRPAKSENCFDCDIQILSDSITLVPAKRSRLGKPPMRRAQA
jgi:hypothetical protein